MHRPLRRQILLPMAGVLLAAVGVLSALSAWLASGRVLRRYEQQVADLSRTIAESNFPLQASVLRQMRGLTAADYVLTDRSGRAIAASDEAFAAAARAGKDAPPRFDAAAIAEIEQRRYFHVALRVRSAMTADEPLILHAFYSEAEVRDARSQAAWPSLAIGASALAVITAVMSLLVRRVTGPLGRLQAQVARVAGGDFRPMTIPASDDEVRSLAIAVNQMAHRLARYENEIRSSERLRALGTLGGGIAHQIRNSVTGCRLALELHRRDARAGKSDHAAEALDVALRQLSQVETSIQRLLTLGKPAAKARAIGDLAAIVRDAIELVRPMAMHQKISLVAELPPVCPLPAADNHGLTQMVVNLAVNAIEAAAQSQHGASASSATKSGHVQISLAPLDAGQWRLAIANTGTGPSPEIQRRLFEPFATDKPGGTGLGLAVARQIADDHGGTIDWRQSDGTTCFFVTLSAADFATCHGDTVSHR